MSTKKELLAQAKELNIVGRHDMSVDQLSEAINLANEVNSEIKKPTKNLVKNTNIPWRRKYYFLDLSVYQSKSEEIKKVASQVQLMLKYMAEAGLTSDEDAEQGQTIASDAIAAGYVKTKIEPNVLFAYYRKTMEAYGLVFAGYNLDN